jgi:hypothetical protein
LSTIPRSRHLASRNLRVSAFASGCALACLFSAVAQPARNQEKLQAIRWNESKTGCTFSQSEDGKYHYGMWVGDVGVTMSVDAQEVEKIGRRHEPFFSLQLQVNNRGKGELDVPTENISFEFTDHFKVVQPLLDPDRFSEHIQNDADALDHETAREVERHPEKKEEKEAYAQQFQKDAAELIEFVTKNGLHPARLDAANPQVQGWLFFSAGGKWLGGWKKQEEFVLRVPLNGKLFEFPFKLPPKPGELVLRKRE